MSITALGKSATIVLLAAGLVGCIDASVEVAVTSPTTAKATLTQVMGAEVYDMMVLRAERASADGAPPETFCADGVLTKDADGSAVCVVVAEGPFADLTLGADQGLPISFTPAGTGLVRVALPTEGLARQARGHADLDAETAQMLEALLAGRKLTLRFSGLAVSETNMVLSEDATSAEQVIGLLDLVRGKLELPEEFYAVVQVP